MRSKKAQSDALVKECDLLLNALADEWLNLQECAEKISVQVANAISIRDKVIDACSKTTADIFDESGFMSKATAIQLRASMMKWLVAITKMRQAAAVQDGAVPEKIESDIATIREVILMIGEWEKGEGRKKLDQVYEAFPHDKIEVKDS